MYPWVHIKPFKNDKYDIHNYLLRKILICSLRNVVIFTLSLRLRENITTFLRGTYQYLPFGASYVYSIFIIFSGLYVKGVPKKITLKDFPTFFVAVQSILKPEC